MLRAASARSIRPPTRLEICEIITAIKAAKTTAQSAEVTAGLTCMRVGNVALIQPLISAAAVIRGTNERSNTARDEQPRKARNGHSAAPAVIIMPIPDRKKPQAVENATGMVWPP